MRMLPSSSLTVPDVQLSRFRFFMEEFRSRRCSDGRAGLLAGGDAFGAQRIGSNGADSRDPAATTISAKSSRPDGRTILFVESCPICRSVDTAPTQPTVKASASWLCRGYRGASAPAAYASRKVLPPSMQDSLPAGWLAFTGRELNPLDRDEGFQITSSSSLPGLFLAQRLKTCTARDSRTAKRSVSPIALPSIPGILG